MARLSKEKAKAKDVAGKGGKWERWITSEVTNTSQTGWAPWTFWFFSNSTCQSCHLSFFSLFFLVPLCSDVGGSLLCGDNRCLAPPPSQLVFCVVYPGVRTCFQLLKTLLTFSVCHSLKYPGSQKWQRNPSASVKWLIGSNVLEKRSHFFSHFFLGSLGWGGWSFGSFASRRITHSLFRLAHIYARLACVRECVCAAHR